MSMDFARTITGPDGRLERLPAKLFYENLSWRDIKEMSDKDRVIICQPLGAVEQHGPHGPLDMDINTVRATVPQAAYRATQRGTPVLVAPLIPYGFSLNLMDEEDASDEFPGTITFSAQAYFTVLMEVCKGFIRAGFRRIALVTGHGNNLPTMQIVGREIRHRTGALVMVTAPYLLAGTEILAELEQGFLKHAEEFETSITWVVDEESLDLQMLAERRAPVDLESGRGGKFFRRDAVTQPASAGRLFLAEKSSEMSRGGVIGDPHLASKEKGERFVTYMVDRLTEAFEFFGQVEFGKGRDAYIRSTNSWGATPAQR